MHLPNYQEGLGIAILEAMAMGVPVVAFDSGGAGECFTSGEHGFITRQFDVDEAARKVLLLTSDRGLRAKLGAAALLHVAWRFSREQLFPASMPYIVLHCPQDDAMIVAKPISRIPYDVCIIHLADARFYPFFYRQAMALAEKGFRVALVSWEGSRGDGDPAWPGIDTYPITIEAPAIRGKLFFIRYFFSLTVVLSSLKPCCTRR